jgi:hypothetical protein
LYILVGIREYPCGKEGECQRDTWKRRLVATRLVRRSRESSFLFREPRERGGVVNEEAAEQSENRDSCDSTRSCCAFLLEGVAEENDLRQARSDSQKLRGRQGTLFQS